MFYESIPVPKRKAPLRRDFIGNACHLNSRMRVVDVQFQAALLLGHRGSFWWRIFPSSYPLATASPVERFENTLCGRAKDLSEAEKSQETIIFSQPKNGAVGGVRPRCCIIEYRTATSAEGRPDDPPVSTL